MLTGRKPLSALCALLVLLLLVTGCTGRIAPVAPSVSPPDLSPEPSSETPPPETEPPLPEDDTVIRVGTVDEFIEAIASDTEIFLEPGVYDISAYGKKLFEDGRSSGFVSDNVFFDLYNDYAQLTVANAENLVIRAEGAYNTKIITSHIAADVICFEGCDGVTLEGVTLGHSPEQGQCSGDVLEFSYCSGVELNAMDLYGCGAYAISALNCSDIRVNDSTLRDCSYGAIFVLNCGSLDFDNCDIKNCEEYDILDVHYSSLHFDGCRFDGNSGRSFVNPDNNCLMEFTACSFGEWESAQIAALDSEARLMFDDSCFFDGPYSPTQTVVESIEQLAEAVAPGARIVLRTGNYNISDWLEGLSIDEVLEWNDAHTYVGIEECYDGRYLVISNTDGISISGGSGDRGETTVETDPRYADVLKFKNCTGVTVSDITLGHSVGGECAGSVIALSGCTGAVFDNVDLYGCGTEGIYGYSSGNVFMYDSFVHDCMFSGLCFENSSGYLVFQDSVFTDNGSGLSFYNCDNSGINFFRCTFGQSETNSMYWYSDIATTDCIWSDEITSYPDYEEDHEDEDYPDMLSFDAELLHATSWFGGWSEYFGVYNGIDAPSCTLTFGVSDTGTLSGYYDEKADFSWQCSSDGSYAELSLPHAEYAAFEIYAGSANDLLLRLDIDGEIMWFKMA